MGFMFKWKIVFNLRAIISLLFKKKLIMASIINVINKFIDYNLILVLYYKVRRK